MLGVLYIHDCGQKNISLAHIYGHKNSNDMVIMAIFEYWS